MIGRLSRVFQRYADARLRLSGPGRTLTDEAGGVLGQLEEVALSENRLHLHGVGEMERIGASFGRVPQWVEPVGGRFCLDIPFEPGAFDLYLKDAGGESRLTLPGFSAREVTWRRALLWGRYVWDLAVLTPHIWRWKRQGDLAAREKVKERLGLVPKVWASELKSGLFAAPPAPAHAPCPAAGADSAVAPCPSVSLVMPVYNAFELLQESLARVAQHSGDGWRLILVEDCSTNPRVRPFLEQWAASQGGRVQLLCNPENLGFIGAVNRGLEAARRWPDDPVVLLNSDALVPAAWLPRLLAPLHAADVASVTPLSNDAEIFTVPVQCQRVDLEPGVADHLDAVATRFDPEQSRSEAPTGVGFCMALAPQFLAQIPQFDTAFGRGYGEEVDWCQKALRRGGRHLCAGNLFVEHRGGESFGSAAKQALLERNGRRIAKRYPGYDQAVQDFIRQDPLNSPRLALALAWAGAQQEVPVYLAHAMGGGAEQYLRERIDRELAAGRAAVVLRVGQGRRWRLELHSALGVTEGLSDELELVDHLLALLPRRRLIYSCGVGDRDAASLPGILLRLAGRDTAAPQPIEVLLHDFFPISPSYTLLGSDGGYHGVPRPGSAAAADPAHSFRSATGELCNLEHWQQAWGQLLVAAEQVTVFSENSRMLLQEAYPQLSRIVVRPHALPQMPPPIAAPAPGAPVTIGVLGNIGLHKGAMVLQQLSEALAVSGTARLVVLGHLAPEASLRSPSEVHGAYQMRDLPDLVARYGIQGWFMPSVWPETFSFTCHEMLATSLPVVSFDLGAQGEAVARAVAAGADGGVLPFELAQRPELAAALLAKMGIRR